MMHSSYSLLIFYFNEYLTEMITVETVKPAIDEPVPLLDESRPTSEWIPFHVLEEQNTGIQRQRSWLGTYIVGKDYWAEKENNGEDKLEKVR